MQFVMALLKLITLSWLCAASAQYRSSIMFPNERTTLDDCHLRYFKLEAISGSSPANGQPTRFREFAHMAALGWTEPNGTIKWQCGGSLVWDNFVLTAAHCVLDARNRAPDIVRLGDLNLYSADDDQYAQQFRIEQIIRHPEHKFSASYHDVALLKLDGKVTLDQTVLPACLWRDNEVRFKRVIATGWGSTGFAKKQTPIMLKVELSPIKTSQCNESYPKSRRLRQGLLDQHLCAVDELMDTCEGDSGGPLQVKLMHNSRMSPFIIGVTSFGTICGMSNPGVYARVSSYYDWIVATMRQNGAVELDENYNETFCALRFATYREFDKQVGGGNYGNYSFVDSSRVRMSQSSVPSVMVEIGWPAGERNCHGVIVDEDTVIAVADCTDFEGKPPTHIVYHNQKVTNISKILVHPNHIRGSGYNNIAILKMSQFVDVPLRFQPSCIYHGMITGGIVNAYGHGRHDINRFLGFSSGSSLSPIQLVYSIKSPVLQEDSCVISDRYLPRLPYGLTREQLCVGNDVFLVPGSCDLFTGGVLDQWLYRANTMFHHTFALSLLGRDCGFGEHIIATRLASHVEWMKSVLLPKYQDTASDLRYVDPDLGAGDNCTIYGSRPGRCVPLIDCSKQWREKLAQKPVTFCSTNSIVCCCLDQIGNNNNEQVHADIYKCADSSRNQSRANFNGSIVHIGWVPELSENYACPGVVISKTVVLTTASCLESNDPYVVFPINGDHGYMVQSALKHAEYNSTDKTNDLAIIKLRDPLGWSEHLYPVCLWTNKTHTPIVMDLIYPATSYEYDSKIMHPMYNSDCQRTHPYQMTDSQMCVRDPRKNYTCMAVSDSLLWWDPAGVPFLVGIAVNVSECDRWRYMVYTRISSYVEWISENAFGS